MDMVDRHFNAFAYGLISILFLVLSISCEQKPETKKGINLNAIRELALLDRHSARDLLYTDFE